MKLLQINLFGVFKVEYDGQKVDAFKSSKVQELLSYLVLYPNRPHSRERLAQMLSEHWSTAQSRTYLRRVLWQLQQDLVPLTATTETPVLRVESEWIQFNMNERIWVDVRVFEQAYSDVQGQLGMELEGKQICHLDEAVCLYQGDLLETCYKDWCLHERERLQHLLLVILDKLMSACEAKHHYEQGISYGQQILRYDEAREHTHRQLMRLHYLGGKRTAALLIGLGLSKALGGYPWYAMTPR